MNDQNKINLIGVGVDPLDPKRTVEKIVQWTSQRQEEFLIHCTVHTLICCWRDTRLRKKVNGASIILPDGMPLVWLGRLYGYQNINRVYGPHLMMETLKRTSTLPIRHYLYGGKEEVLNQLVKKLLSRFPELKIAGSFSPPYRSLSPEEDEEITNLINKTNPHIVWVGLGTPKQDLWVADHVGRIHGSVLIPVGAAFDFISGNKPQAPSWIQRIGLEWLFRLCSEPRRLWRRYVVDNPLFIILLLAQILHLRRYEIEMDEGDSD